MTLHPLTGTNALVFALGLSLVLAGAHLLLHGSQLRRRGRHTYGTVIDAAPDRVRIAFRATDGELLTVFSRYRLGPGSAVPLYYDPERPTQFAIDSLLYRWGPYGLLALGLGIMPLAWLL